MVAVEPKGNFPCLSRRKQQNQRNDRATTRCDDPPWMTQGNFPNFTELANAYNFKSASVTAPSEALVTAWAYLAAKQFTVAMLSEVRTKHGRDFFDDGAQAGIALAQFGVQCVVRILGAFQDARHVRQSVRRADGAGRASGGAGVRDTPERARAAGRIPAWRIPQHECRSRTWSDNSTAVQPSKPTRLDHSA